MDYVDVPASPVTVDISKSWKPTLWSRSRLPTPGFASPLVPLVGLMAILAILTWMSIFVLAISAGIVLTGGLRYLVFVDNQDTSYADILSGYFTPKRV